jgi:hypothetical protein
MAPRIYSASNRNKDQNILLGGKVRPARKTDLSSPASCLDYVGSSTSHNP